jgi:hypothetical protein
LSAIRCPRCGTVNHADDIGYPHCGQCHEDLVRCTVCRRHDGETCTDRRARAWYVPGGEAAKRCSHFVARHAVMDARWTRSLPAPLWVGALMALILVTLIGAALFIDPAARYFRGNPMEFKVAIAGGQDFREGEPFLATMQVANLIDQPSTRVFIEVDERAMRAGALVPEPDRLTRHGNKLVLEYAPLPPRGRMILQMQLIPRRPGPAAFSTRLYAPRNHLRGERTRLIEVVR